MCCVTKGLSTQSTIPRFMGSQGTQPRRGREGGPGNFFLRLPTRSSSIPRDSSHSTSVNMVTHGVSCLLVFPVLLQSQLSTGVFTVLLRGQLSTSVHSATTGSAVYWCSQFYYGVSCLLVLTVLLRGQLSTGVFTVLLPVQLSTGVNSATTESAVY